jgi:uncharacterized repeat protein (TIGR03803 family)
MQPQTSLRSFNNTFSMLAVFLILLLQAAEAQETVLYNFSGGSDGNSPKGTLVQDSQGNLYGTTTFGGDLSCDPPSGCGTVFEVAPAGIETVLYSFNPSKHSGDGSGPQAGLVFDSKGNLYGTTQYGGNSSGTGTVFELSPNPSGGWTETVLYQFCLVGGNCTDGSTPYSSLVFDQQGNLYGTTFAGGTGNGVVFELSPNGQGGYIEAVIHSFAGGVGGGSVLTGVAIDHAGNLYGTTASGGVPCNGSPFGCGTVYKLSPVPGGWTYVVILEFTGLDGASPVANLIVDSTGNLYGTAEFGGLLGPCINSEDIFGCGTVFELSPTGASYTESVLYRFAGGNDGENPYVGLAMDSDGNLYGTTLEGGGLGCGALVGCGTAFELERKPRGAWQEIILNSFTGSNGAAPKAALYIQGNPAIQPQPGKKGCIGNCYGSCTSGGTQASGVVYALAGS